MLKNLNKHESLVYQIFCKNLRKIKFLFKVDRNREDLGRTILFLTLT